MDAVTTEYAGMHRLFAIVAFLALAACGGTSRDDLPPPSSADAPDAAAVAAAIDADLTALARMNDADRFAAEKAFGPRLERDIGRCQGTRHENKPTYLLAQWLLVHGRRSDVPRILALLDRLEALPMPAYRVAGQAVRVRALLRIGRLAEARQLAQALERDVPEFGSMAWVRCHELVGTVAPAIPGVAAGGGAADATAATGGPLLVAFVPGTDPASSEWLGRWTEITGLQVRAVVLGSDLLAAGMAAAKWGCPVRWCRPDDQALAPWRLAGVPLAMLVGPGPDRIILAVDPRPSDVAQLIGPARP